MAMEFIHDTPEELETKKRLAAAQRLRKLIIILVVGVIARVFIKNPPPPKTVDRSHYQVRYVPGILDSMSKSDMDKMDPRLLAQLRVADKEYRLAKYMKENAMSTEKYKPADQPLENKEEQELLKQMQYVYAKRQKMALRMAAAQKDNPDLRKTMLVRFRSGGFIKAEKAARGPAGCDISIDRSLMALLPNNMVSTVSGDAANWKPPVPPGYVELKPAKGISITVSKESAKRISIRKQTIDET